MLFDFAHTGTVEEMLDKFQVKELIEYERFCRDNALWEPMLRCFAEDSQVEISWYQGSGAGFVAASQNMKTRAPHKLNNTLVWVKGDRAATVTMGCIQTRSQVGGQLMDLTSYVRFLYTLRRAGGRWQIVTMNCIYEKDCLTPAWPELACEQAPIRRESYGNLARVLGAEGYTIAEDLPGDDRPEITQALFQKADAWLCE